MGSLGQCRTPNYRWQRNTPAVFDRREPAHCRNLQSWPRPVQTACDGPLSDRVAAGRSNLDLGLLRNVLAHPFGEQVHIQPSEPDKVSWLTVALHTPS